MADKSKIEWTDATWGPVVGCTKVSPGCDHCYAERHVNRFAGHNTAFPNRFDVVTLRPQFLELPLRWKKSRRIFVNSMADLFHEDVPDEYIVKVFAVMALAHWHTFQVLTKRHGRMRSLLSSDAFWGKVSEAVTDDPMFKGRAWQHLDTSHWRPLPNVWLGVSVENQQWADIRIPALLETPAVVRFLSCEPLLGPVLLSQGWTDYLQGWRTESAHDPHCGGECRNCPIPVQVQTASIGWVIVGGESGPGARPMHPKWPASLRDQCVEAGVPFLFKQWGSWAPGSLPDVRKDAVVALDGEVIEPSHLLWQLPGSQDALNRRDWAFVHRASKKAAGRELDDRTWDEYPEVADA